MKEVIEIDGKKIPIEIEIERHVRFTTNNIRVGYSLRWQNLNLGAISEFFEDFIKDYGEKEAIWVPIKQQFSDKKKLNLMAQRSVRDALLRIGYELKKKAERINTMIEISDSEIEDIAISIESAASSLKALSEWRSEE